MFGDTDRVWHFVWALTEYVEAPFILIISVCYTFLYVGWYGFIVMLMTGL